MGTPNGSPRRNPRWKWLTATILIVALVSVAVLSGVGSPEVVSISGYATSKGATTLATMISFTAGNGGVFSTSVLASIPHGGSFQIWLPNNADYEVQITSVGTHEDNMTCEAGTLSVHQGLGSQGPFGGGLSETYSC